MVSHQMFLQNAPKTFQIKTPSSRSIQYSTTFKTLRYNFGFLRKFL